MIDAWNCGQSEVNALRSQSSHNYSCFQITIEITISITIKLRGNGPN
jgi:hypothetical protein